MPNTFIQSFCIQKLNHLDERFTSLSYIVQFKQVTAPYLTCADTKKLQDPHLHCMNAKTLAYSDVFVNDFLGNAQETRHLNLKVLR